MSRTNEQKLDNFRNEAEYWETRYLDMRGLLLEAIALQAGIICELMIDIELLQVDSQKGQPRGP